VNHHRAALLTAATTAVAVCTDTPERSTLPSVCGLLGHMHHGCLTSITIRDVPDDVRDELGARARLSGRSLQEYLRSQLVALASCPDPEVLIGRARERTGSRLAAERILAHGDHDRR
jgi:antitoxin FitA